MAKHTYYFYDQQAGSFAQVKDRGRRLYRQGIVVVALACALAFLIAWGMDAQWIGTPEEVALRAENEVLQEQLSDVSARVRAFSRRLEQLAATDQELYRTLLRAKSIPEDVRRMGVGGAELYEEAERFSEPTAALIRRTSRQVAGLERRMDLQRASFRQLSSMAEHRREKLAQLPAILPANGPIISGYGLRRHPILDVMKMHAGVDVLVREGTSVVAPGDGIVQRIGRNPGYGNFLEIGHPATGYTTRYAHLSEVMPDVEVGEWVERGQKVALSGSTGRSTGPHLHYEVLNAEGRTVDPIHFFAPSMTPRQYKKLLQEAEQSGAALDY